VKYRVSNSVTILQVESTTIDNNVARVDDVAKYGEQQFTNTTNHLAIDKGTAWCAL